MHIHAHAHACVRPCARVLVGLESRDRHIRTRVCARTLVERRIETYRYLSLLIVTCDTRVCARALVERRIETYRYLQNRDISLLIVTYRYL